MASGKDKQTKQKNKGKLPDNTVLGDKHYVMDEQNYYKLFNEELDRLTPSYSEVTKGAAYVPEVYSQENRSSIVTRSNRKNNPALDEETQVKLALTMSQAEEEEKKRIERARVLAEEEHQLLQMSLANIERKRREEANEQAQIDLAISLSRANEEKRIQAAKKAEEDERQRHIRYVNSEKLKLQTDLTEIITDKREYRNMNKIINRLNSFELNTKTPIIERIRERNNFDPSLNEISLIILEVIKVLKNLPTIRIEKIFEYFAKHILLINDECIKCREQFIYNPKMHELDKTSEFSHQALDHEFVCCDVRGDGNCLWNSVSVSLFGDYSFMESLRLLTATTLLNYKQSFQNYMQNQKSKFGYSHELTFDQLVESATDLSVWGDELHVLALSLALSRPIYSYGSFINLIKDHEMSFDELKRVYESEWLANHFRYIGDTNYEKEEPICLYYNGENHYSVVLPKKESHRGLVPNAQLLEPIFYKTVSQQAEQSEISSNMKEIIDNNPEHYTSVKKLYPSENDAINEANRTSYSYNNSSVTHLNNNLNEANIGELLKDNAELKFFNTKYQTINDNLNYELKHVKTQTQEYVEEINRLTQRERDLLLSIKQKDYEIISLKEHLGERNCIKCKTNLIGKQESNLFNNVDYSQGKFEKSSVRIQYPQYCQSTATNKTDANAGMNEEKMRHLNEEDIGAKVREMSERVEKLVEKSSIIGWNKTITRTIHNNKNLTEYSSDDSI